MKKGLNKKAIKKLIEFNELLLDYNILCDKRCERRNIETKYGTLTNDCTRDNCPQLILRLLIDDAEIELYEDK